VQFDEFAADILQSGLPVFLSINSLIPRSSYLGGKTLKTLGG